MNETKERYQLKRLIVEGYKSLRDPVSVEFGRLTVLAGANSSGKSSLMQPLLLLKQTFEAPYDPGRLLLDGANISLGTAREALWKDTETLTITLETAEGLSGKMTFRPDEEGYSFRTAECVWSYRDFTLLLQPEMPPGEVKTGQSLKTQLEELINKWLEGEIQLSISEKAEISPTLYRGLLILSPGGESSEVWLLPIFPWMPFMEIGRRLIHVPALRGNPQRRYLYTIPVKPYFPGLFPDYVAGIIALWQEKKDKRLKGLWNDLRYMGLTWKVEARRLSDKEVELRVGRLCKPSDPKDTINIADAGFGISQGIPVVVALRAAEPGRMVYIEQPEIHLHPDAQVKLADLLVQAAQRDVQVVVETHSDLILLGIQKAVAEGKAEPNDVKLHWFERDQEGVTCVRTAEMDEEGTFGDWPVDFDDVAMDAMDAYLDAVAQRRSRQQ